MPAFTSYAFTAKDAPTPRTMPARLAEIFNVKDWGAMGNWNGVTGNDDTTPIQNAMNALMSAGGGTLFFPPGRYRVTASITFNNDAPFGLHVLGSGTATAIEGNFAGYIFSRSLATPNNTLGPRMFENIKVSNPGGGSVRLGSTIVGGARNCLLSGAGAGFASFTAEDAPGFSSDCITIDNCGLQSGAGVGGTPKGIVFGGKGCIITGCDIAAYDDAITVYGYGVAVYGCRMESLNTSLVLGVDSAGTDRGLHGLSIMGMPMEGNLTSIDFRGTVTGFAIGPNAMTGHDATNAGLGGGTGSVGTQYGVRIRANKALAGEFFSVSTGSWIDIGGIYIEDYTVRANVVFHSCQPAVGGGAGVPWRIPTKPSGFKFVECNIDAAANAPNGTRYLYANLPTGGLVLEGDEYDISDAATGTIGSATVGSGSLHRRVRWDGTSWIVTSL